MSQPKVRAQSSQEATHWGHWSECSENCVKIRHRLNCDDILPQASSKNQSNSLREVAGNKRSTFGEQNKANHKTNGKRQVPLKSGADKNLPESNDVINDRYIGSGRADDEEDDSLLAKSDQIDEAYLDDGDDEENQEAELDSCANVETGKTFQEAPCTGGLCRRDASHPVPSPPISSAPIFSRKKLRDRAGRQRIVNGYREQKQAAGQNLETLDQQDLEPLHRVEAGLTRDDNGRQPVRSESSSVRLEPGNSTGELGQTLHSSSSIWRQTASTWPPTGPSAFQLAGLNTARIIEWTIIVGSLLSIVLLLMLILRKLFASTLPKTQPSYHWMLAKQTLKEQQQPATYCQPVIPQLAQAKRQAGNDLQFQFWPGHAERQITVDTAGRHLFGASFNTDAPSKQAAPVSEIRRVSTGESSVISLGYNYDTLNAGSSNQLGSAPDINDRNFLPTRDFVPARQVESGVLGQADWSEEKHKSPNVPKKWTESGSSSLASSGRSSATAQMLSNAVSSGSSFEHPQLPDSACLSSENSPASVASARGPGSKLIGLSLQPTQSHPNTPIFAPPQARTALVKGDLVRFKSNGQMEMREEPSQRRVLRLASEFESAAIAGNGLKVKETETEEDDQDRHLYEEICESRCTK